MKKLAWKVFDVAVLLMIGFALYGCVAAAKGAAAGATEGLTSAPSGMSITDWLAFTIANSVSYGLVSGAKGAIRMKLEKAGGGEGE